MTAAGGKDTVSITGLNLAATASGATTSSLSINTVQETTRLVWRMPMSRPLLPRAERVHPGGCRKGYGERGRIERGSRNNLRRGGSVSISGDIGDDKLNLSGVNVAAATNGGVASSLNVDAGAGDDKVSLSNSAADSLFATLGAGKDTLNASGALAFANSLHVQGDAGRDTLNGQAALTASTTLDLLLDLETLHL